MSVGLNIPKTTRRSAYDIELDGEGLHLIEAIDVRPDPGSEPPPDAVYDDFSRGMGYSEHFVEGTYGWADGSDDTPGPWGGACTRIPGVVMPGGEITEMTMPVNLLGHGPFRNSIEFGGNIYFFGPRYILTSPSGTGALVMDKDLGFNVEVFLGTPAIFGGSLYVPSKVSSTGAAHSLWKNNGAGVWSEHATVTRYSLATVYWEAGGVGAHRLIGMDTGNSFKTVSGDPTVAANWSAAVTITPDGSGANLIRATAKHVYFVGNRGVFDIDSVGRSANIAPYFRDVLNSGNGTNAIIDDDGYIHVNAGNGIYAIPLSPNREPQEFYQPGAFTSDASPIWGFAGAPSMDHGWLIWSIFNPVLERSYIMYARRNGEGGWDWHGAEAVFPGLITHTRVTSPTSGSARLWVCTQQSGSAPRIFWMSLPFSGNPYQDWVGGGSHRFASHGSVFVGDRWVRPATKRAPLFYNLETENTSSVSKVSVWRRDDKEVDGSGVPVYTRKAVAQSRPYESTSETSTASAARTDLRIDLDGTATEPAFLRSLRIEADVNVHQRDFTRYTCVIRSPDVTARGTTQRRSIESVLLHLKRLQGVNATPVEFKNILNQRTRVQMLPTMLEHWKRARNGEWECVVTFVLRTIGRRRQWGSGVKWGSGAQWGMGA